MFKVGDKVKVVRVITGEDLGNPGAGLPDDRWINSWNSEEMDPYVNDGEIYTIKKIMHSGVYFVEKPRYGWPPLALKLANKKRKIV